jgi:predicted thioesterase
VNPEIGLTATATVDVSQSDTAVAHRCGSVNVLATPRLLALCEEAAIAALDGQVDEGCTTVGLSVQMDHLRPVAVGVTVVAKAQLDKIEGRKLVFTVSAKDDRGLIAAGKITRVVVDVERFMEKTR